jgi:arginyl-tRNA--protein-N-Asp/Glu arginylyltransferase
MRTGKKAEDSIMWPSNMTMELTDEQIETLVNYRNQLDSRMINNEDKTNHKWALFHESQQITKFINEYRKRNNRKREVYLFNSEV